RDDNLLPFLLHLVWVYVYVCASAFLKHKISCITISKIARLHGIGQYGCVIWSPVSVIYAGLANVTQ
uniref:Uncharacterized protein n=1 Tax=Aegilops tauschii subsp. strangulata TaxID=200361 RepID=A0A453K5F0_AEGTS